ERRLRGIHGRNTDVEVRRQVRFKLTHRRPVVPTLSDEAEERTVTALQPQDCRTCLEARICLRQSSCREAVLPMLEEGKAYGGALRSYEGAEFESDIVLLILPQQQAGAVEWHPPCRSSARVGLRRVSDRDLSDEVAVD